MKMLWSHSEACHGKDLSDPECGRCKFALEMAEMRHTAANPTEMKTSKEAYDFLCDSCQWTHRDIFEKKGVGIYRRQFYWAGPKEMWPLAKLAEVRTISGSDSWHMFYDTGHTRHILVRELACFSCNECKQMKWRSCKKIKMHGPTMSKEVIMESANRVNAPLTASRITKDAKEAAAKVEKGMLLGVECASEQEPYIIVKACSKLYTWQTADEYTWMGWMRAGDRVIDCIKYERYGCGDKFWCETKKTFPIFEEDLRSIITGWKEVEVRKSSRNSGAPKLMRIEVGSAEIEVLEERVMAALNTEPKSRTRQRTLEATEQQ